MNILLACSAGMSTSILVSKMKASAEQQGKKCKIWAISFSEIINNMKEADVILLGPQIKYKLDAVREEVKECNIPVDVIPMLDYGMCNGVNVLKFAEELIQKNK